MVIWAWSACSALLVFFFSARALERFLEYIMTTTAEITASKDAKTLTSQHILEVVTRDTRLNFLKEATLKSCSLVSSNNGVYAGADGE